MFFSNGKRESRNKDELKARHVLPTVVDGSCLRSVLVPSNDGGGCSLDSEIAAGGIVATTSDYHVSRTRSGMMSGLLRMNDSGRMGVLCVDTAEWPQQVVVMCHA